MSTTAKKSTSTARKSATKKTRTSSSRSHDDRRDRLVVDERILPDSDLPTEHIEGILDIAQEGSGLIRPKFSASDNDVYISASQIRRFNLRVGDFIGGRARRPKENERYWGLLKVETINGKDAEDTQERVKYDDMTAIYPDERIVLSTGKEPMTTRVIDLVSPIGFGQRGLIVSPPKAGKTWLIKDIISGIAKNYPEKSKGKTSNYELKSSGAHNVGEVPVIRLVSDDIDYNPLNYIVLQNGICISIREDDVVEVFHYLKPDQVKEIKDSQIDSTMRLCKNIMDVRFFKGNKLFSFKVKK